MLQERLRDAVLRGDGPETLLLCEHDPVITLGRRARPEHLLLPALQLRERGIAVATASRGGEVTYHGPGQLVAYPVLRVRRGVVAHVEAMARGVVQLLERLEIAGKWRRETPGVWVARSEGEAKICAFGIHVRHRVAVHGLALNVSTDLRAFETIVPCGMPGAAVTSIARENGCAPAVEALAPLLAETLAGAFGLRLQPSAPPSLPLPDCQTENRTDNMNLA